MQVNMKRKWRHWALCVVLVAGSSIGAWLLGNVRFFQILNLKAYDARHATRPVMLAVDTIATLPLDAAAIQRGYVG